MEIQEDWFEEQKRDFLHISSDSRKRIANGFRPQCTCKTHESSIMSYANKPRAHRKLTQRQFDMHKSQPKKKREKKQLIIM